MGCCFSSFRGRRSAAYLYKAADAETKVLTENADSPGESPTVSVQSEAKKYPWDNRPKLDPKDFMFEKLKGVSKIKEPGTINGQQFIIDTCEDCDLYVLDYCAQVTIDDCKNCRIFIGPTEASVFIRDCENCAVAVLCRQFRTRDCIDCDISLHCGTKPVIETSKNLRFGCYDFQYDGLGDHLASCLLSYYANHYSHIHDYTPSAESWSFLPHETTTEEMLKMPAEVIAFKSKDSAGHHQLVRTLGERDNQLANQCCIVFPPDFIDAVPPFLEQLLSSDWDPCVLRTNFAKLDSHVARDFASRAALRGDAGAKLAKGKSVYLEIGGDWPSDEALAEVENLGAYFTTEMDAVADIRYSGIDG